LRRIRRTARIRIGRIIVTVVILIITIRARRARGRTIRRIWSIIVRRIISRMRRGRAGQGEDVYGE